MANPIWKDFYVNLGTAESVLFRIIVGNGGTIVYLGKAFKRPDKDAIEVKVNDICADYLDNNANSSVTFLVQALYGSSWVTREVVVFTNDWSYDYSYDVMTDGMAFPINGKVSPKQWLTYSVYEGNNVNARLTHESGIYGDYTFPVLNGMATINIGDYAGVEKIEIGNTIYHVVSECSRYVLYYVNAYGGWDSLLIEGNHSISDNLTRHTRETEYDNRSIQNRGVHNYVNEISKTMTLHTSWLSDEESSRMHHLLNSTNVYLGDLVTGQIIPVILTNTTTEYKTYKGNGGRLVNYAINVEFAQERIRR